MSGKFEQIKSEADSFYDNEDYENALSKYSALEKHSDSLDANQNGFVIERIALCNYYTENYDEAAEYFLKYLELLTEDNVERAVTLWNIGNSFYGNSENKNAAEYYLASLAIYVDLEGEESENVIALYIFIGNSYNADGKYSEAEPYYLKAIELAEKVYGIEREKTNLYRYYLGENYYEAGEENKAFEEFKLVYKYFVEENEDFDRIDVLDYITNACNSIPADPEQEIYFDMLYKLAEQTFGEFNLNTAVAAKKYAKFFDKLEDYRSAAVYFEKTLNAYNDIKGELDPDSLLIAAYLATAHYNNDDLKSAKKIYEFILSNSRRKYKDDEKPLLTAVQNLAYTCYSLEEYDTAEKLFEECLAKSIKINGPESLKTTNYLAKLADIYYQQSKYSKAVEILKNVIHTKASRGDTDQTELADLYAILADNMKNISKKASEAEIHYNKAIELYEKDLDSSDAKIIDVKMKLASIYSDIFHTPEKALEILSDILSLFESDDDENSYYRLLALIDAGDIHLNEKRFDDAKLLFNQALNLIENSQYDYSNRQIYVLKQLSKADLGLNNLEEAEKELLSAYRQSKKNYGQNHKKTTDLLNLLKKSFGKKYESDLASVTGANLGDYYSIIKNELSSSAGNRNVRVFISSTFRDMMNERDYLMKSIFPEIKKSCKEFGIDFTEVDLRWGVTEEEAEQGKVIEICLNEIDKSRPYFIGILGERYGWIPDKNIASKIEKTLENFQWLNDDIENELSITEMEIQYGVLRNPEMKGNAFFYLRDIDLTPDNDEFFEKPDSKEHKKLIRLKKILQEQKEYPVREFNSIKQLGEIIANDLQKAVIRDSNLDRTITEVEQKRIAHLNYIKQQTDFYIPIESTLNELTKSIEEGTNKIVLFSQTGKGKSALISHWIKETISGERFPIVFHFAEADPLGADFDRMLDRISSELKQMFGIEKNYPINSPNPAGYFAEILADASIDQKVIIVIDGVEKIEYNKFFAKLYWLPQNFPYNIHFIISTKSEEFLDLLLSRGFDRIDLDDMKVEQKQNFIVKYLDKYGKKLPGNLIDKILKDDVSDSPHSMQIILDELRLFGVHEELEKELQKYLSAENSTELFIKILDRIERDYESDFPGLISKSLSLLAVSKNGLTEQEIIDLTDSARLFWSPVQNSIDNYLIRFEGLIRIKDAYLKAAIEKKYLSDEKFERSIKQTFADYLLASKQLNRKVEELGDLLLDLKDKKNLVEFIGDLQVCDLMISSGKYEDFVKYNNFIKDEFDIAVYFRKNVEEENRSDEFLLEKTEPLLRIANILSLFNQMDDAHYLAEQAFKLRKEILGDDHPLTADALIKVADLTNFHLNDQQAAKEMYKKAVLIIENNPYKVGIKAGAAYSALADIYLHEDNIDEAWKFASKSKEYLEKAMGADNPAVADAYNKFGQIELKKGNLDSAEKYIRDAMKITAATVGENSLIYQGMTVNLISVLEARGEDRKSLELLLKTNKIMSEMLGKEHPAITAQKFMIASKYFQLKDFETAENLLEKIISFAAENNELDKQYAVGSIDLMKMIFKLTGRKKMIAEFINSLK